MRITIELLRRLEACLEQQRLFEEKFPTGVDVTRQVALAHADDGFDIEWIVNATLTHEGRDLWNQRCSTISRFLSRIDVTEAFPSPNWQEVSSYLWDEYRRQQAVIFADLADRYAKESITSFNPATTCPICGVVH